MQSMKALKINNQAVFSNPRRRSSFHRCHAMMQPAYQTPSEGP